MAHSIIVDLMMRTGSFETDTKRAQRALARMQKQAADAGKVLGSALAAGAVAGAYAFDQLVKSAADFQDLSETTGAQAEDLASLALAAGTAGVEMQTLAGNAIRLTKSLTGVDDDSKAAGAAIKALGLDLKTFKQLDPVAQIDALSEAFDGFADGPEKSAVAVALWGKSGAEMLKLLKALEEQGGRTRILTQQQIEDADRYADAQAKAGTELKLYAQAAATQALPAFFAMTEAATAFIKQLFDVDAETGKLRQSTAIKDFATAAVQALAFVVDIGDSVIRVVRGIGMAYGAVAAAVASLASGDLKAARTILGELGSDLDALANRKFFSQLVDERLRSSGAAAPALAPDKPRLRFEGAADRPGKPGANKPWPTDTLLIYQADQLRDALEAADKINREWEPATFVDSANVYEAELLRKAFEDIAKVNEEAEASAKKAGKELDLFGKHLAENIQDTLGDGLYRAMTGNFDNIASDFAHMLLRMAAQAQAADLARAIFGADPQGGLSGGWLGKLVGEAGKFIGGLFAPSAPSTDFDAWDFRAAGGPVNAGQAYMVGERGPELFRPYAAGRVLPNNLLQPSGPPKVEVVNNLGVRAQPEVQQGPDGALRIMLHAVADDTRRGGVTARATAGRFGVNNGATLNRRRG